jgi:hypothetical protein
MLDDRPQIVLAPEPLVRALHAACSADSDKDRVTYLRCEKHEQGLKIAEIGLGEKSATEPTVWQDAKAWWKERGEALSTPTPLEESLPEPAPLAIGAPEGPTYRPGEGPLETGGKAIARQPAPQGPVAEVA